MWLRKIQRKKLQYSLVALILFFTSMILSGCLIFTVESSVFLNRYYSKGNLPDTFAIVKTTEAVNMLQKAEKENEHIKIDRVWDGVDVLNMYAINGKEKSAFYTYFYQIEDYTNEIVDISIYKGEETKAPKDGEIWISKVFADLNDIKVGDLLTIQHINYRVGAIVKNPLAPSSTVSIMPAFCNKNTYEKMKVNNGDIHMVFLTSDKEGVEYSNEFVKTVLKDQPESISYVESRKEKLDSIHIIGLLFGGIGAIASIMIFVVSLVIVKYIIKSNISKEYHVIGIYKALGDSNKKIQGIYLKSFSLIGMIGISLGAVVGILIANFMYRSLLGNLTNVGFTYLTVIVILGTIVALMLVLIVSLRSSVNIVRKISPVEALRMGMTSTKKKLTRSVIKNAHSPFAVAVNEIAKYKWNSILVIFLLSVSFFLSLFFINMKNSMEKSSEHGDKWFSIPKADATISGTMSDELAEYLQTSDYVASYQKGNVLVNFDFAGPEDANIDFKSLMCSIFDDPSTETTKIPYASGRAPQNAHEIAFTRVILKDSPYQVGDYITMTINGYQDAFLITGMFDSMMNNKRATILQSDIYEQFSNSEQDNITYMFVKLNDSVPYDEFVTDITNHVDGISVNQVLPEIKAAADSVVTMARPICLVLVLVFILFSIINIINLLAMEQINHRTLYGILKSLGFSNAYICMKSTIKIMLLTIVSVAIALTAFLASFQKLFLLGAGVDGAVISTVDTIVVVAIIFALILAITMVFCVPLRKIAPKDLMEE
ncbi:MAG: FtsX-like permease family protein [Clostridiales bacterium]|nr:FtsX-like permease family protein [Clostridiales bacterium]